MKNLGKPMDLKEWKRVEIDAKGQWNEIELKEDEIQFLKDHISEATSRKEDISDDNKQLNWGRVVNSTAYKTGVYGPKSPRDTSPFDNTIYVLPPYKQTPDNWDADGAFIPNDVEVEVGNSTYKGPLAVKITDPDKLTLTGSYHKRQTSGLYLKILKSSEVNWFIPNVPQSYVDKE